MAYNQNIPQPTDQISVSQAQLLANFQAIQTLVDVNHVDFASADQGKHKIVTMPQQAGAPVTGGTEVALVALASTLSGVTELNFCNAAAGTVYEFTSSDVATTGWTRTAAGTLYKWGNVSGNGATVITFPVAGNIPVFGSVASAQVSINTIGGGNVDPNTFVVVNAISPTQLTVYCGQRTAASTPVATNFTYLVIGQ